MPFAQRLTCTIYDACEVTGLGRTKPYELIAARRIVTTTIERRRLVVVRSLLALLDTNMSKWTCDLEEQPHLERAFPQALMLVT